MKHPTKLLLLIGLLSSGGAVFAHGEAAHGAKKPAVVKKEQKPWGIAGDPKAVSRTIEHGMHDTMRFTPDKVEVKLGDTIKFIVKNDGKQMHEFVIGTRKELDEHAALMLKFPEMEHDEPYMTHVPPGKAGEIVWKFNRAGEFDFACLIPGHYQAGMVGKIKVASAVSTTAPASAEGNQAKGDDSKKTQVAQAGSAMADAEVRKVDKDAKKITLRHGEIKSLDMPPMTMVFQVKDPAMLDKVQVGDKVKFQAVKVGNALVVTSIEVAK